MRTSRDRMVFLLSAALSGLVTMALASAATSPAAVDGSAVRARSRADDAMARSANGSGAYCLPDACTRVAKTPPGGPRSMRY